MACTAWSLPGPGRLLEPVVAGRALGPACPCAGLLGLELALHALGVLDAEELLDQLLDRAVGGGHVARRVVASLPEVMPTSPSKWTSRIGWPALKTASLSRPEDGLAVLERRVRGRVLAEDLLELVALLDQARHAGLLLGGADDLLLAHAAHEVGVLVAEARVLERLLAAQPLVARRHVDVGVLGGVVEVAPVDVDVDAADRVDRALEALEVDVDHVVDREPGELLDRLQRQRRAAELVGRVDLVGAAAGDLHLQVARQRHQRGGLPLGVEPGQDDRVRARAGAGAAVLGVLGPPVGAQQQDRLRLARVGLGQVARCRGWMSWFFLSVSTTLSTSWNAATEVAPAVANTTRKQPRSSFFQSPARRSSKPGSCDPQPGLAGGQRGHELVTNSTSARGTGRATRSRPTPRARGGRRRPARTRRRASRR